MEKSISLEKCAYCRGSGCYGEWGIYPCTDCEMTGFKHGKKALEEYKRQEQKMFEEAERWIKEYEQEQIQAGYVNEELKPIKCKHCGSKEFKKVKETEGKTDDILCELVSGWKEMKEKAYQLECDSCSEIVGRWENEYWHLV